MTEKSSVPAETPLQRWWWRVWYVFFASVLVWLGACVWLSRPTPSWTEGWLAWSAADRFDLREVQMLKPALGAGTDVLEVNNDPAFRFSNSGEVLLGHWPKRDASWTWSGWVRCSTTNGIWPEHRVNIWTSRAQDHGFQLWLDRGVPYLFVASRYMGRLTNRFSTEFRGTEAIPLDEWTHLAFVTDGNVMRVIANGRIVAEKLANLHHDAPIHLAPLYLLGNCQAIPGRLIDTAGLRVLQDDIVLYDRAVPMLELQEAAAAGRGRFVKEISRRELRTQLWTRGWPAAATLLVILISVRLLPGVRNALANGIEPLRGPSGRPIRWTLAAGSLLTVLLTGGLYWKAQVADFQRFAELLMRLKGETDLYWERMAGFANQARDWMASHPNATQAEWDHWLNQNHYPHDMNGMIGIGYAVQVQPGDLARHEAEWTQRLGHAYRVHPVGDPSRQNMTELEGNPHLPVVLFSPRALERSRWQTNHTILGRDLLHVSRDDPRRWAAARHLQPAISENEVKTSSMETIAPESWYGTPVRGVQIFSPLTTGGKPPGGMTISKDRWQGVVFANIDIREPLKARYGNGAPLIGCRMRMGGMGGDIWDTIADTGDLVPETAERPNARLRYQLKVPLYGSRIFIDVWTTPAFENQSLTKWAWVTGLACGFLTLLSVALLVVQIRAREAQGRVLNALEAANRELLEAYRERERLSRDLHDGSIQNLYALGLHLQRVQGLFGAQSSRAKSEISESLAMLDHSIVDLRQFILSTERKELTQQSPVTALHALVEQHRRTTDTEFIVRLHEDSQSLSWKAGAHLLPMAREGISNALRHGKARRIELHLDRRSPAPGQRARWVFEVRDNGLGFEARNANGGGLGLKNLKARAAELGGECVVESELNCGTTVRVTFIEHETANHE